jgi:SAM-dependent methyltransferase
VVRSAVLAVNTPLAKARLGKAVRTAARPAKLEIGGLHRREGWIVTNVNAVTRNYMDATTRWPFEDGALSHVYADNVIEHISLGAGRAMLAEAYRCLRPGGVIRLVTPDIGTHVELYLKGADAIDGPVGRRYRSIGMVVEHPVDLLRIPIGQFGHHIGYVYDFESLARELTDAGFHSPARGELGSSGHAEFVGIEQRAAEGNAQLVVEAVR